MILTSEESYADKNRMAYAVRETQYTESELNWWGVATIKMLTFQSEILCISLEEERGIVKSRVASVLRTLHIKPLFVQL